jgi:hypothetical protein
MISIRRVGSGDDSDILSIVTDVGPVMVARLHTIADVGRGGLAVEFAAGGFGCPIGARLLIREALQQLLSDVEKDIDEDAMFGVEVDIESSVTDLIDGLEDMLRDPGTPGA